MEGLKRSPFGAAQAVGSSLVKAAAGGAGAPTHPNILVRDIIKCCIELACGNG